MTNDAVDNETGPTSYWAPDLPLLKAHMLLPRVKKAPDAFPFNHPHVQYVHFARNAIFKLAGHFGLRGAEVLVPAYFHGVEVEALVAAGVRPRFFPVRSAMRVDPEDVIQCIRPETRAVYLIHYLGFPGPAEALARICADRGLVFIEDCALALLSAAGERPLGSFADASVFCMYKTLPTVDGGAVVVRDGGMRLEGSTPPFIGTAREVTGALFRSTEHGAGYALRGLIGAAKSAAKGLARSTGDQWVPVGTQDFNQNDADLLMSNVSQVVLAAQDVKHVIGARRRNFLQLDSLLRDLAPSMFPALPPGLCPLFYPFVTREKIELWKFLRARGVQAVLFWLPRQFAPAAGEFPEVDELRQTVLELPCHQDMTSEDIDRVAQIVRVGVRRSTQ